jgi:hypothetical protein
MRLSMLLVVVVALAAPVAAFADGAPTPYTVANQICKQAQASLLAADFAKAYGTNATRSNAFGKCVAAHASAATQDVSNAAKTCKTQQADTNFAATHDGKTFDQVYGASKGKSSGANAFGKCVSQAASAAAATQAAAVTSAAKSCKAALKASAKDFAAKYGTGRNAFGKCVAATSKTQ